MIQSARGLTRSHPYRLPSTAHSYCIGETQSEYQPSSTVATPERVERTLGDLDPRVIFESLRRFHRAGNRARLGFLEALERLDRARAFYSLGYSSTRQLLMAEFGLTRSSAGSFLQVARKTQEMPRLVTEFREGRISWSKLRHVSRIVDETNESAWLKYLRDPRHGADAVAREVRLALREGRGEPRQREYGLPNRTVRVSVEFTLEEKQRFDTAMARIADDMGEPEARDLASVLLYLSHRVLNEPSSFEPTMTPASINDSDARETGDNGGGPSRAVDPKSPSRDSALTVLYQQCPSCRVSGVHTRDGLVEVDPQIVARTAAIARVVAIHPEEELASEPLGPGKIDSPNGSRLTRQVLCRDGNRCANPHCDRTRDLQAHHIQWRSAGGRTELANETTLCSRCHGLVHAGLVEIHRDDDGQLLWQPQVRRWFPSLELTVVSDQPGEPQTPRGGHSVAPAPPNDDLPGGETARRKI